MVKSFFSLMSLHINLLSVGICTRQGLAPVLGIWYDFVGLGKPIL